MNASFSYDEQKKTFEAVYDFLIGLLNDNFEVSRKIVECYEITMSQFIENMVEAIRRENINYSKRMLEHAHLWYYSYYINKDLEKELPYRFDEKIIDKHADSSAEKIYDPKFIEELRNIEAHPNESDLSVNMVHYIISGIRIAATSDMVSSLARSLMAIFCLPNFTGRMMNYV